MTETLDKDFKVKNGLQVAGGATFGGPVTATTPSNPEHLATKGYVDAISGGIVVGPGEPSNPVNGIQWFDTEDLRLKIYYEGSWFGIANIEDTLQVPQHTHDSLTGLINYVFLSGGGVEEETSMILDGGAPGTLVWAYSIDSGTPEVLVSNLDGGTP